MHIRVRIGAHCQIAKGRFVDYLSICRLSLQMGGPVAAKSWCATRGKHVAKHEQTLTGTLAYTEHNRAHRSRHLSAPLLASLPPANRAQPRTPPRLPAQRLTAPRAALAAGPCQCGAGHLTLQKLSWPFLFRHPRPAPPPPAGRVCRPCVRPRVPAPAPCRRRHLCISTIMPHRPLPAGFAEALGSVQRARAAKRAQKQKGDHGPPPEALSGTDTEREGDERRGDREQEQQRRQVEQDCQRRLAEDRRGEASAAKALRSAERRERARKQAEEAEKRRLAEAEAETRRRDEEAAAAAHAQARRQAEEAARVVTEADDERDAESDELEPRSPAACASPEVAQHEHDEQSKPIEKSDLGFAKHSEAERVEGQFVEGGEERLEGQSESSAADVPPVVAPTQVEAAPTVEARVNSESLQHDSSAERDPAPDSNGGVLELRQAIKRKPNAETSAAPKAAPQPPGAASPLASSKRVRRASQDPNKLRQIQQALIGNSSRPQEEEEERTVRLAEDLQEQAVETQEEAPANSEGEAWEDPTEEAVEDREEASVEAQEEALENPEGEAWEDWAEEAVEDQKEPSVALRLVVAPVNGVGEYQESGPREDLLQPPSPNSSKLSEDPWPDKERQYVDSPEGLDNLSEGTDPGSERASHSRATVCQAKGKVDTASETPAHHRSRPDQAFDDKPLRSPIDEALSKLAEQRRERETRKGAARDRFDRHRQSSPSPELYLDQLAESGNTVGRGHSLVHNRLVPLQSPETIRSALAAPVYAYSPIDMATDIRRRFFLCAQ